MNDRDCNDMRRLISDGIDHPLAPDAALRLQVHLTDCAECAAFERAARSGSAGITALPATHGSAQVRDNVMASVYRGPDARPVGWRGWARQGLQVAGAGVAFALVAVVLMAVIGSGSGDDGDGDGERTRGGSVGSSTDVASPTADSATDVATTDDDAAQYGACQPGQVSFETWIEASSTEGDDAAPPMTLLGVTALKETGGTICQLDAELVVSLRDALGQLLDVEGNEQAVALSGLVPSDAPGAMFAWENWCGAAGDVSLRIEGAGSSSEQGPIATPECYDENMPSRLGQSAMAESPPPGPIIGSNCGSWLTVLSSEDVPDDVPAGTVALFFGEDLGADCGNDGALTLTIRDSAGELLDIENNPLELTLEPSADDPNVSAVGVIWSNWCGVRDDVTFEMTSANSDAGSGGTLEPLPTCTDSNEPSRLTVTDDVPGDWKAYPPIADDVQPVDPGDLPACEGDELDVMMKTDLTDAGLRLFPIVMPTGEPCTSSGDLTISVQDAAGNPLDIRDNPATVTIDGDMAFISGSTWFMWSNWCGAATGAQIVASFNDLSYTLPVETLPACTDDSQPATLDIIAEPLSRSSAVDVVCSDTSAVVTDADPGDPDATLTDPANTTVQVCAVDESQPEKEPAGTAEP